MPLLAPRNASLTPDKGYRELPVVAHIESFSTAGVPPQIAHPAQFAHQMHFDPAARCQAPMFPQLAAASYFRPQEGTPAYVMAPAPGTAPASRPSADPHCASLLHVLAEEPVEDWVNE
eukprot:5576467-Prymnesium_polylepis.1